MINNQGPQSQTENDETSEADYPNENDSEHAQNLCNFQLYAINITRLNIFNKLNIRGQYKFLKFKAKRSLQCGSYLGQRLRKI